MTISAGVEAARAAIVGFSADALIVGLADGREIRAPLNWFPRLHSASHTQRNSWRLIADGIGIHWPAIDEDISVAGLLTGIEVG